ncbi:hypothetical protein KS871_004577 [Vibrio parahaemolyticus]|nr:hypothetical protein [Vibrio parahaemolyticus]USD97445.1 hypothetical protein CTT30_06800 [Vibrio coralliilyticus]
MNFIKLSMLCFISVFVFQLIALTTFPSVIEQYEWISWVEVVLLSVGVFGLWLSPAVVAFRAREVRHRFLIIFLSLGLPIVGGFIGYFILKGEIKHLQET